MILTAGVGRVGDKKEKYMMIKEQAKDFRVITNGSKFRIQGKGFWGFWHEIGVYFWDAPAPYEFSTLKEAENIISNWMEERKPFNKICKGYPGDPNSGSWNDQAHIVR